MDSMKAVMFVGALVLANWSVAAPSDEIPCQEHYLNYNITDHTPIYSIHNESLSHVTAQRDSAGRLTHLEQHVAVQADGGVCIRLTNNGTGPYSEIPYYDLCIGWSINQYTDLFNYITSLNSIKHISTPDILSAIEFKSFYLKIDNGTLEFGKEGEPPLVSHVDASFGAVNYFQFYYGGPSEAKIRYDCPAPVEQ